MDPRALVPGFMLLAACAGEPRLGETTRSGATTLAQGDRVALWLLRYETCRAHAATGAGNCEPKPVPPEVRQRFLECLTPALGRHGASAVLVDDAAPAFAVPAADLQHGIAAPSRVAALVAASARREALMAQAVRYLVVLQATTRDGPRHTDGGIDLAFTGVAAVGRTSERVTSIVIDVFQFPQIEPRGHLELASHGRTGWTAIGWLIPVLPVPYASRTEAAACESAGAAVAEFLAGSR